MNDRHDSDNISIFKLNNLKEALETATPACAGGLAPFINSSLRTTLYNLVVGAINAFNAGNNSTAQSKLNTFIGKVKSHPTKFNRCHNTGALCGQICRNAPGELIARAESARFMICGARRDCQRVIP